jgi:hypothetical protein
MRIPEILALVSKIAYGLTKALKKNSNIRYPKLAVCILGSFYLKTEELEIKSCIMLDINFVVVNPKL